MKSFKQFVSETKLNPSNPHEDYKEKSKALHQLSLNKDVDQAHVTQRKLDLDKEYSKLKEDGGAAGMGGSSGPTNNVSGGAVAGTGGKGGEPGVYLNKKKKSPILLPIGKRKSPQF
jgi:hypothetical protein